MYEVSKSTTISSVLASFRPQYEDVGSALAFKYTELVWKALAGYLSLAFTLNLYTPLSSNSLFKFVKATIISLEVTAVKGVAYELSSHLNSSSGGYIVWVSTEK